MTMRVAIIGAGGHGQVVADILLRMQDAGRGVFPVGFLDENTKIIGESFLGLPVMGTLDDRSSIVHDSFVVAIGDNPRRRDIFRLLLQEKRQFAIARHPKSVLAPDVRLGSGSMVCAGVVVNTGTMVGANVILNTGCTVDHHNLIGDHVHIAPGVHLGGQVTIGEGTLVGIGATVMPGKTIGAWSVVGAGALVHEDVPDGVVVVGMPAKLVRKLQA